LQASGRANRLRCMSTVEQLLDQPLDSLVDNAPVIVWVTDETGACTYLNRRWTELTGQTLDQALGLGWLEMTHPDDRARAEAKFRDALAGRTEFRFEYRLRQKDGEYRWAIDSGRPRFSQSGDFLGHVGSAVDIHQRKMAEDRLAFRENQLRLAVDSAEIGLWDVDLVENTLFWPARVKAMFGISPDVPVSMDDFYAGLHPDDREWVGQSFAAALDPVARATYDVEYRTVGKEDGALRWVAAKGRGIFDQNGTCVRVIGTAIDITERKRREEQREKTEQLLRASEQRLRLAAHAARIGTWDLDLNTGKGEWDETAFEIGGMAALGTRAYDSESWARLIHEEDRERVRQAFEASLAPDGPAYNVEFRGSVPAPDGGTRWLASHGAVLRHPESGEPERAIGIVRDITSEKWARAEVEESGARFQALVATVPSLVWFAAPNGDLEYLNDRWYEYTGQTPDEALPHGWAETLHPEDAPLTAELWARACATGESYEVECRYRRFDGLYRWHLARAEPLCDGDGRVLRWFGTSTDIHDRKMAIERLELALNAGAIEGTWVWDIQADRVTADERFARTFGLDLDTCRVGVPISAAVASIHPEDRLRVEESIRQSLASGGAYRVEYRVRNREGVYRWVEASGQVELAADGTPVRFPGVAVDVESRRMAEERERLLAREVDHRAKNLLGVIQSVVQLTRSGDVDQLKAAITGRIQALARAHSLLAANRWEGVELEGLVREELAPFERDEPGRLSVCGPLVRLRPASSQALALALHELATNAANYGALSDEAGRVEVRWELRNKEGAAGSELELIWSEHDGPSVSSPSEQGFGSIVMKSSIERQLGGRLEVDYAVTGLVCRILLPSEQLAEGVGSAAQPTRVAAKADASGDLSGRKLLIVEDEALIALQIEETARSLGCRIVGPATDAEQALQLIRADAPELAIIDVNLGGERSDRVAQALVAFAVPFAYCTGYADTTDLVEPQGGAPRLKKPIEPQLLAETLRRLLGASDKYAAIRPV
jgi:PAS domain S-box-containing protein